jgi:hypothetical protein
MTPAETLHHIRAVMAGGDAPAMALWKINRVLNGAEPLPFDPDDNSWVDHLR